MFIHDFFHLSCSQEENRSAAIGRQQMLTEKDGNLIQTGGGSVRNEEKTRRLLAGGEGLDQKIKKKRSVGAVGNRIITGEWDIKRATLPKANADLKMRVYDAQGFRCFFCLSFKLQDVIFRCNVNCS